MQGARRRPWWLPWASRATPQTPQRTDPPARPNTMVALEQSALPTLRDDRADFPSCGVVLGAPAPRPVGPPRSRRSSRLPADLVASLLGTYPTASAPPCLRGNLPRSRPRRILIQAPRGRSNEPQRYGAERPVVGLQDIPAPSLSRPGERAA